MNTTVKQIIAALLKADDISSSGIIDNYVIYPQTWASTTLGFGGVGGDMMTTAPTTAIETAGRVFVFFGERLAYSKAVSELPEGLYARIFNLHAAPSVREFLQLVTNYPKAIR